MKKNLGIASLAALATVAIASPAFAADQATPTSDNALLNAVEGTVSANVAYTTDYRFRGISQTDRDFAIQGGFDYAMNSGFFLGTWASNVDNFNPSLYTGSNGAQTEVDLYGGYGYSISDKVAVAVQALYFYYPGASTAGPNNQINYWEYTPSISYSDDNLSASLSVSYSHNFYSQSGHSFYTNGTISSPLTSWLTLGAHAGYQTIHDNDAWGTPDYADWSISLATDQFGLNWKVAYVDTDLRDDDCFGGANTCGSTAVGTISKSF